MPFTSSDVNYVTHIALFTKRRQHCGVTAVNVDTDFSMLTFDPI